VKLAKSLHAVLAQLDEAGCTWTKALEDSHNQAALKLEKLGLVKLRPCYTGQRARGACRGRLDGYDVMVTPAGKALLLEAARR